MKAMGVVFSNIHDSSLGELTDHRTIASLPFGGRYRFIDFVLSNMSNSGIYNIGVITKYNYRSLMDHLGTFSEWDLNRKNEGVVIIPPFAGGNTGVYKGKLEALYNAVSFIDNDMYDYVVVSDSTVLCNMDYNTAIRHHIASKADVTVISNKNDGGGEKMHPLVIKTDKKGNISELLVDSPAEKNDYVGMGMFIFGRQLLVDALKDSHAHGNTHLEREFIQRKFKSNELKVSLYTFDGVVLRNESISSYYANNMALLNKDIRLGLFKKDRPIYTKVRDEIPTYYAKGSQVDHSLVADGCTIYGKVKNSVLFRNVKVQKGSSIDGCIIMQGARVGKNVDLYCVILDKNVTVKDDTVLKGTPEHAVIIKKGETV